MKNIFYQLTSKIKIALFAILAFVFVSYNANAQNIDSKGKDFWLMFNTNYSGGSTLKLFITSSVNTNGNVSIPGLGTTTPFAVTANTVTEVDLDYSLAVHSSDVIDTKGIHVTSDADVSVYGLNYIPYTTDAYLGLPTDALGTDYIILTYTGYGSTEFGVVATEDNTTVTITPSVTAGSRTAGVPYNIVMNAGETYEINSGYEDITGSFVTSDKPIGVFGANSCANIPPGYGYCDHICEMLPSTDTWGKLFGTVPLASRQNGDTWRFLASTDNTIVKINGVAQSPINKGQFIETILTDQSIIESNQPILVAQFSNGSTFSGNPGDPFMMLIPPLEQFLPNYTLTTVSGYAAHYINLIAPNSVIGALTLDGTAVPAGSYTAIGSTGYSGAQLSVSEGSHTLNAGLPFGAFQYGFNTDDSYGYPGGQSFSAVAIVTSLDLTPKTGSVEINTNQCFTALISDQNSNPVSGVGVVFKVLGANDGTNGFAITDANGQAQFCYDGPNEGKDTIVATFGVLTDTSFFTRTNSTPNCTKYCAIDNYRYQWKVCAKPDGANYTATGTVNIGGVDWNVWGTINCSSGLFELHAINPNADNCASGYVDSFIYRGYSPTKCKPFVINVGIATWKSYCSGEVVGSGVVGLAKCGTFIRRADGDIQPAKLAPVEGITLKASPNPAQNQTTVSFNLAKESKVNIVVYNYMMQPVKTLYNGTKSAGNQSVTWDARNSKGSFAGSGLYKVVAIIDGQSYSTTVQIMK